MGLLETTTPSESAGEQPNWPLPDSLDAAIDAESGLSSAPSRLNHGMVLLAGAVLIAVATLFVMRKTGATSVDGSLTAVEIQIEKALAQMGGGGTAGAADVGLLMRDTEDVIAVFAHDASDKQVELAQLSKNPFELLIDNADADSDVAVAPDLDAQRRERRVAELRNELKGYELQTVVKGRTPMAVISGKVVKPRDRLGSFLVALIEDRRVVLSAEGNAYQLLMKQPDMAGS